MKHIALTSETWQEISRMVGEPQWLGELRREAWELARRMPMPSPQDEEWRRLDITGLDPWSYTPYSDPGYRAETAKELPSLLQGAVSQDEAGTLIQHNSANVFARLREDFATKGVIFTSLDRAVVEHPDLVRQHLYSAIPIDTSKFTAIAAALRSGGTFVYVPKGVTVELPLHSLLWADGQRTGLYPHTLIVAEEASQVAVVEEHNSEDGDRYVGHTVEIVALPASVVTYVYVQDLGRGAWNLTYQKALSHRDSTLDLVAVAAGGRVCKANIYGSMVGSGSIARLSGFYFGDDDQVFDFHTLQDHVAPHTTSDLLYKGVLRDRSRATYAGLIRVERSAQGTDAYQANRNLLLNPGARADSIPTLEIQANDVRCTHGATVSRIDEDQLYYLMTRGLPPRAAEHLVVEGFFEPIVERIPLQEVRRRVSSIIDRKMEAL